VLLPAGSRLPARARQPLRWALEQGLPTMAVRRAARGGDLQARLIVDPGARRDPYPTLDALRARGPLVRGRLSWASATHATCREVLRSDDFVVGAVGDFLPGPLAPLGRWARVGAALGPLDPPSLLASNPPEHSRYRRLVSSVFTARAVEALRGTVERVATGLLDDLERAGRAGAVDLVAGYATLLPVTVIAEILGVPPAERARVLAFGEAAAPSLDLGLSWREARRVDAALRGFEAWLGEHIARLRVAPGEDLLSQLVAAEDEGRPLTDTELKATAGLLLAAGFETTVNLLGNGVDLLLRHRQQRDRLLAGEGGWAAAVEEVLRVESPVQLTARSVARDTTIAGQPLRRGDFVATMLAGANRDPDVFADPHAFDVGRPNAREHLSFSGGRHFCLGAALARVEGEVGLGLLHERFPRLERAGEARRRGTRVLRGWSRLPVSLGSSSGGGAVARAGSGNAPAADL